MRILIIHNRYSRIGGEEKVVETQKRLLESASHEVYLYTRDYHEMEDWKLGKIQSMFSALYSKRSVKEINNIIKIFNPQVAIVHNLFPIISAAVLKELKKTGIRIVMSVHNYRLFCPIGLFFNKGNICTKCADSKPREFCCLLNKCQGTYAGSFAFSLRGWWSRKMGYFDCIDRFLSVSEFQRNNLIHYGIAKEKITVIPNCIRMDSETSKKGDYIGFAGRLSPEKGIDLLFEIASKLPDIKFKVAGDKAPGFNLPNLPQNVELVGFLNGKELKTFFCRAKALIFTSKVWEAMPLSPLEAMASGTVVIANKVSSLPEILDNGKAGMLFQSAEEGAKEIQTIIDNPTLRMELEKKGIERIKNNYSESAYIVSLIDTINSLNPGITQK